MLLVDNDVPVHVIKEAGNLIRATADECSRSAQPLLQMVDELIKNSERAQKVGPDLLPRHVKKMAPPVVDESM